MTRLLSSFWAPASIAVDAKRFEWFTTEVWVLKLFDCINWNRYINSRAYFWLSIYNSRNFFRTTYWCAFNLIRNACAVLAIFNQKPGIITSFFHLSCICCIIILICFTLILCAKVVSILMAQTDVAILAVFSTSWCTSDASIFRIIDIISLDENKNHFVKKEKQTDCQRSKVIKSDFFNFLWALKLNLPLKTATMANAKNVHIIFILRLSNLLVAKRLTSFIIGADRLKFNGKINDYCIK